MKVTVINGELNVGAVKVISISGSSVFLVGDTQTINSSSVFSSTTESIANSSLSNETTFNSSIKKRDC
jgi:spore germination protein PD